jgi:pyruvate carboxylase
MVTFTRPCPIKDIRTHTCTTRETHRLFLSTLETPTAAITTEYWEECRGLYAPFESGQKSGSADVYLHEMPGGQVRGLCMYVCMFLCLID